MIYQIESVKTKTAALPTLDKNLLQARRIQARLKEQPADKPLRHHPLWSPITPGPFLVPVTRWVE
jgi:hypothetical protein